MSQQKPFTYSRQPPGVKKCFIKGEALGRLRTDSSQTTFEKTSKNWENRLIERDYPVPIVIKYLSELKFADRKTFLQQSNKSARKKLQPSVTKGCCRCTLLAENSSISLAGREKQIHFSQQSPKMLWSCFSFFFLKISRWVSLYSIVELGEKNYRWAMEQNFNWNFRVNLLWFSRFFFSFLD